jgi:hypothetical protein
MEILSAHRAGTFPISRFISVRSRNVRVLGDGGLLIRIQFIIRFAFFLFPFVSALVSDT